MPHRAMVIPARDHGLTCLMCRKYSRSSSSVIRSGGLPSCAASWRTARTDHVLGALRQASQLQVSDHAAAQGADRTEFTLRTHGRPPVRQLGCEMMVGRCSSKEGIPNLERESQLHWREAPSLCAGPVQPLGGASPLPNLMAVKGERARKGDRREARSEGSVEHTCEARDKKRIEGARVGRVGTGPRSP